MWCVALVQISLNRFFDVPSYKLLSQLDLVNKPNKLNEKII